MNFDFQFLILDENESPPFGVWYQRSDTRRPFTFRWESDWSEGWRNFRVSLPVVGMKYGNRADDFLLLANRRDFSVSLEREPDNPHDKNAIKVIGQGTVAGVVMRCHLGYVPREHARDLGEEIELRAHPFSLELPHDDYPLRFQIQILVRSASYRKKFITVVCPKCAKILTAPMEYAGRQTLCANCETSVSIPKQESKPGKRVSGKHDL